MEIEKFIASRPLLYHLTSEDNLNSILKSRMLYSTEKLTEMVKLPKRGVFLETRRRGMMTISDGDNSYIIRDQDKLSGVTLGKCLEPGWSIARFVAHVNARVFFWPTEKDLEKHFARYSKLGENVVILRVATDELFAANDHQPRFCNLNSGAPRPVEAHGGKGAPRGSCTFRLAAEYPLSPGTVREVTFESMCKLPEGLRIGTTPRGIFKNV